MPIFTFPLALIGMAAAPAVAAIYLLRSRSRRYPVSSLMLWMDQKRAKEGGLKVQRIEAPLLLLLEILAVIFLVLAAAGPRLRRQHAHRPLAVVLDDSYSMIAAGKDSPRNQAAQAMKDHLAGEPPLPVQFVLAGREIRILGEPTHGASAAARALAKWDPQAPTADLDRAISLAGSIAGSRSRILVLTDHPPKQDYEKGRLEWWAFGRPLANAAIINAARTGGEGPGRCLLEVANLSPRPKTTRLLVQGLDDANRAQRLDLALAAGETRRLMLKTTGRPKPLRLALGGDAVPVDDEVILLPERAKPVRVQISIGDKKTRELVKRAMASSGQALLTDERPELYVTDRVTGGPAAGESGAAWPVRILSGPEPSAFAGPFVLDRRHPLTDGLGLEGVAWGASRSLPVPGMPVITAGNVPLVTDAERLGGAHEIRIQLRPELSTVTESPNWPILIWNLLRYRASTNPGLQRCNVRLGMDVVLRPRVGAQDLRVIEPGGHQRRLPLRGTVVTIPARRVGLHEVYTSKAKYAFVVNAMCRDESDLSGCATGRWGNWLDADTLRVEYRSLAWVFLLLALAALLGHMALLSRRRGGFRR